MTKGSPGQPHCICGRVMQPVIGCDGKSWRLWYACFEHPGMAKLSTDAFPLPASLSPPAVRLSL